MKIHLVVVGGMVGFVGHEEYGCCGGIGNYSMEFGVCNPNSAAGDLCFRNGWCEATPVGGGEPPSTSARGREFWVENAKTSSGAWFLNGESLCLGQCGVGGVGKQ